MNNKDNFSKRFKEAFGDLRNKDIAELLGVSKATVTLYMQAHLPPSGMLLTIAEKTGCNLHWLMTGNGPKWAKANSGTTKRKGEVIALYHAFGGTGKSAAASFLGMSLARRGYKTLLVEPFGEYGVSYSFFPQLADMEYPPTDFSELYPAGMTRCLFKTPVDNLDLHAGSSRTRARLLKLGTKNFLITPGEVFDKYSFIIVDVKSKELLDEPDIFKARLLLSAKVLISCAAHRGVSGIENCLTFLKHSLEQSDEIKILGAFLNMSAAKRRYTEIMSEIERLLPSGSALQTIIHFDSKFLDSQMSKVAIYDLQRQRRLVKEYDQLAEEIILRIGITER